MNNIEVVKSAHMNKIEVSDKLKVQGLIDTNTLHISDNFRSKTFNITDDIIDFNSDAFIKLNNSKLTFKVKDIFEVITFMKYIVKICGTRLEKCDFGNLLKNSNTEQIKKIITLLDKKQEQIKKVEEEKHKIETNNFRKEINAINDKLKSYKEMFDKINNKSTQNSNSTDIKNDDIDNNNKLSKIKNKNLKIKDSNKNENKEQNSLYNYNKDIENGESNEKDNSSSKFKFKEKVNENNVHYKITENKEYERQKKIEEELDIEYKLFKNKFLQDNNLPDYKSKPYSYDSFLNMNSNDNIMNNYYIQPEYNNEDSISSKYSYY